MRARLEGTGKLQEKRLQITRNVRGATAQEVARSAANIELAAKLRAPVASGELRDSIHAEIADDGMTATVRATALHAAYVEFGTQDTPAQPFLFPAQEGERAGFRERVGQAIASALRRG